MNWCWSRLAGIAGILLLVAFGLSCAHDQQLVSLTIQPTTEAFGDANTPVAADAGASVQLRALGSYTHPPVTKDVTGSVTWATNTPGIATVDPKGLLVAAGSACGNALISATLQTNSSGDRNAPGAVITGNMTANVVCGIAGPTVTLDFAGLGKGTVSSSPSGLGCASTCNGIFPFGSTITLTAAPNASSFGGWAGCDAVNGDVCTLTNVTSNKTVTATFN